MKLCVVTGETSGDLHAASVIRELRSLESELEVFGVAGPALAEQGVRVLYDNRDMGVVGVFNVIRQLPMFRRIFETVLSAVLAERPDAVLLVDYPDFNLRLARKCRDAGIRVIYYISPQVWAWRKRRIRAIARTVDHMIVIFPFEETFYRTHGVPVTYVGHPLVDQLAGLPRNPSRTPGKPLRIALLPGSRRLEIVHLLPSMIGAIDALRRKLDIDPFIVRAPSIAESLITSVAGARAEGIPIIDADRHAHLASADVAISSSGTATLEAALLHVPTVVVYRLGWLSYQLVSRLVRVPHFSLINIVAGREVVPELIQNDATAERIAEAVLRLAQPDVYSATMHGLVEVENALGSQGASRRAAETIVQVVKE